MPKQKQVPEPAEQADPPTKSRTVKKQEATPPRTQVDAEDQTETAKAARMAAETVAEETASQSSHPEETRAEQETTHQDWKKILCNMYSAFRYAPKNESPQQKENRERAKTEYGKLESDLQRREFARQWLLDRKFANVEAWLTKTVSTSRSSTQDESWLSKYQVAHEEKLAVDNPLLQALLQELPQQDHPNKTWAQAGEKLYWYAGHIVSRKKEETTEDVSLAGKRNLKSNEYQSLMDLPKSSQSSKVLQSTWECFMFLFPDVVCALAIS